MAYWKKIVLRDIEGGAPETAEPDQSRNGAEARKAAVYVTDDIAAARALRDGGAAVMIYLHEDNREQDFSEFLYAVEDPENLEPEYVERVYRRLKGLPWRIAESARCLVRETTPEDADAFYRIYSDPAITEFMEGLYPEIEEEKEYIREYIKKVYTFYEFGVWTVVEKAGGAVIGRAGFDFREGYEEPELGFIIGVPWQRKGYGEEVCRLVMKYGWDTLGFKRVQAMVEPGNEASLRLCAKLGFWQEERVRLKGQEYVRLVADAS